MDEEYSRPGFYWGQEPNRICRQVVDLFPGARAGGKRVIDLGCGEGRDLIYFARHGFEAEGVDLSSRGLDKAQRWAADEGLSIRTCRADLSEYRLDREYDVVYASGVLTYLPPQVRQEAFANYKRFTSAGGVHAFNFFVEKPFIPTAPDWGGHEYFYRSGEVLQHYWDWEIIHVNEAIFPCNSSGVPHQHAMGVMIARKV